MCIVTLDAKNDSGMTRTFLTTFGLCRIYRFLRNKISESKLICFKWLVFREIAIIFELEAS